MCGFVGLITKHASGFFGSDIDLFEEMLWHDQVRGDHGTGIFYDVHNGCHTFKAVGTPYQLMSQKKYDKIRKELIKEAHIVIGHNRAATKGEINVENTHPFIKGHIIGAHNGTLRNHKKDLADVESDSKSIFLHMEKHGYAETLKKIDGPFALIWYDIHTKSVNFVRNFERPLSIIECTDCWIVSSEVGLGKWMAERTKKTIKGVTVLQPRKLYTLYKENLHKLVITDVEYRPFQQTQQTTTAWKTAGYDKSPTKSSSGGDVGGRHFHAWGTKLYFTPAIKWNPKLTTSIFYDDTEKMHFLSGRELGKENSFVKVFGSKQWLEALEESDLLSGQVGKTRIRGNKSVLYTLLNAKKEDDIPTIGENNTVIVPKSNVWGQNKLTKDTEEEEPVKCVYCFRELIGEEKKAACFDVTEREYICEACANRYGSYLKSTIH